MNAVKSKRLTQQSVISLFLFLTALLPEIKMNGQGKENDSHQDTGQDGKFEIKIGKSPAGDIRRRE